MAQFGRLGIIVTLGITTAALLTGCSSGHTQVAWEDDGRPRHTHHTEDWWQYQFVYHPDEQVYFEPYSKTYYWYEGGQWHEGSELPQYITPNPDRSQVVKLKAYRPHAQHHTVVAHAGPERYRAFPPTPFTDDNDPHGAYAGVSPDHN